MRAIRFPEAILKGDERFNIKIYNLEITAPTPDAHTLEFIKPHIDFDISENLGELERLEIKRSIKPYLINVNL